MTPDPTDSPTDLQVASWHAILHRVMAIEALDQPANKAYAPEPLRADIQDCVDRGLLEATRIGSNRVEDRFELVIAPKGRILYDMLRAHLVATGQVDARRGEDLDGAAERSNPFDDMD